MRQLSEWVKKNPWTIHNLQNNNAHCGRYPTREAAIKAAEEYRGGVTDVNEESKTVFVSEIPALL